MHLLLFKNTKMRLLLFTNTAVRITLPIKFIILQSVWAPNNNFIKTIIKIYCKLEPK